MARPILITMPHPINRLLSRKNADCLTWLAVVLCAIAVSLFSVEAKASEAYRCHSIQQADQRQACLARTLGEPYRCHSIRDPDLRNQCLAMIRGEPYRCHSIRDLNLRQRCLAEVTR